jgi:plastocyanin
MDWELLTPGLAFTILGVLGVALSLAGIAETFLEGMHSLAFFVMVLGVILLTAGLFKDGPPRSVRGRALMGFSMSIAVGVVILAALSGFVQESAVAPLVESGVESPRITEVRIVEGSYLPTQEENYSPKAVTVVLGVNNTIAWRNDDSIPHTVTSDTGLFDSGAQYRNYMPTGATWKFTFSQTGEYPYHCIPHPWMKGTVIVKAA